VPRLLEPLPPQPPELTRLVALLQNALRHQAELVERFGMTEIATEGEDMLVVRFSTGWAARVVTELLMPAQSR
jgi:hypothetical protein